MSTPSVLRPSLHRALLRALFLLAGLTLLVLPGSLAPQLALAQGDPPGFTLLFTPDIIGPGSTSQLIYTIDNGSGASVTDLAFTNSLPAGVTIAAVPEATTTCSSATLTAPAEGMTVTFSGGQLANGDSCTVSVNVTASAEDIYTNTTGNLTSSAGNSGPASDDLTVDVDLPGFTKSFSPDTVFLGGRSTLTLTIDNSLNESFAFSLAFTDNLPVGMEFADPTNVLNTCSGGTLTATAGTNSISYSGGFIPGSSTCEITLDVVATGTGVLGNVTGELTSGSSTSVSSGKASAVMTSTVNAIHLQKSFTDDPTPPNGTVNIQFTITNYDRSEDATDIAFTDDLDATLTGLVAVGTPVNDVCGTGSVLSGTSLLTLTGGTVSAGESCTFNVSLLVPLTATAGAYPNTTNAISGMVGGSGVTGNQASDTLFVLPIPGFTKFFTGDPITGGETVTLSYSITNTSSGFGASSITFDDELTSFLPFPVTTSTLPSDPCGAGSSLSLLNNFPSSGNATLRLSNGLLASDEVCTFDVEITIPTGYPGGSHTSTSGNISATIDSTTYSGGTATDTLVAVEAPALVKEFVNDPVQPGGTVDLVFTFDYPLESPDDATAIEFTDDLDVTLSGLVATGASGNTCGGMATGSFPTSSFGYAGGSLTPGDSCAITLTLSVPGSAASGTYANTTSIISATVSSKAVTNSPATDDLTVTELFFSKSFINDPVIPGDTVTLTYTIENRSASDDATSITFTDDYDSAVSGMANSSGGQNNMCGSGSSLSGTTTIIVSAGNLLAGESCTFTVTISVPGGTADGTYRSSTSNLTATIDGVGVTVDPAVDNLEVNQSLLQLEKSFVDDPVQAGDPVTLAYTLTNLSQTYQGTAIGFTDDLDADLSGLASSSGTQNDVCGTGSSFSGTGLLTLTGGVLNAGASCSFSVTLTVPSNAAETNVPSTTEDDLTGTMNGLPVVGNQASDTLTIFGVELSKVVSPAIVFPGASVEISFTITNTDGSNSASSLNFIDDLSDFVPGAVATDLPKSDVCGSGSSLNGSTLLTASSNSLAADASCAFSVTVSIPLTSTSGIFTNTTSTLTQGGLDAAKAAVDTLTIAPLPTFSKVFGPDAVVVGESSTLTFTIDNSGSTIPATSLRFTDTLPSGLLIAGSPGAFNGCGGSLTAVPGTDEIEFTNGSLSAGSTCTLGVDVVGSAPATYTNTSGVFSLAVTGGRSDASTAVDSLLVASCFATADDGSTIFSSLDAQAVRDAIGAASSGDTVKVAGYCAGATTDSGTDQLALITIPLTLSGGYTRTNWTTVDAATNPTTLDAAQEGRVLYIDAGGEVIVENMNMTGGLDTDVGGGIFVNDALLTVDSANVYNNSASGTSSGGGGFFLAGGEITITGTQVYSNTAADGGGILTIVPLTLTNSMVMSNTATGGDPDYGYGGGLYTEDGTLIENSRFQNNTALLFGGGISSSSLLSVLDSEISNNVSDVGGGLFVEFDSDASVQNSAILTNTATDSGGGVATAGYLTVTLGTISGNVAVNDDGGGIDSASDGATWIYTSTISGNSAGDDGGGLDMDHDTVIQGSFIHSNTAGTDEANVPSDGGGIDLDDGILTITNTQIMSNTARTDGGGLFVDDELYLTNSQVYSNTATDGGGIANVDHADLLNVALSRNVASSNGGGIYSDDWITVTNSTIEQNSGDSGGALYSANSGGIGNPGLATLINTDVQSNTAEFGGGIFNASSASLSVTAGSVFSNTAASNGGGLYTSGTGVMTVTGGTVVQSNRATGNGGGIYIATSSVLSISNSSLLSNTAQFGGGISNSGGTGSASGSRLLYNTATANSSSGGALFNTNTFTVTDSCIVENSDTAIRNGVTTNATDNWWGHPSGPSGSGPGIGDSVSNSVDFSGFLAAPILDCPTFDDADVAITKTVTPSIVVPDGPITYTLTFTNTGLRFANGTVITDLIPLSVTINSVVSTPVGSGISIVQTNGSPTFVWQVGDGDGYLPVNAGGTITLTGIVTATPESGLNGQILTNTVTLSAGGDVTGTNDTASAAPFRLCGPGSFLDAKTNQCVAASPGEFVSAFGQTQATACDPGFYQPQSGQSQCLAAPFNTYVPNSGSADFTNCPAGTFNPVEGSANLSACLDLATALTITKQVDLSTPDQGDTVTYTVAISNSSSLSLTNASLTDLLPSGLTFEDSSTTLSPGEGGTTLAATSGDLPTLAAGLTITNGTAITVTFRARVDVGTGGLPLTNTVGLSSTQMSVPFTDTAALTVTVPQVNIYVDSASLLEDSGSSFTYTVTRSAGTAGDLDISLTVGGSALFASDYSQSGTSSFTTTSGLLRIPDGSASASFVLTPTADSLVEADESIVLTLSPPQILSVGPVAYAVGPTSTVTSTITNDDTATVTLSGDASVLEGDAGITAPGSSLVFTATLDNPVDGGFTLPFTSTGNTATDGIDFSGGDGTLTFSGSAGEVQTFTVTVIGDTIVEADETLTATLGSSFGSLGTGIDPADLSVSGSPRSATIINDDTATVTFSGDASILEGDSATASLVFTATLDNPVDGGFTLPFTSTGNTATDGIDFSGGDGTLTFSGSAGEVQTFTVTVIGDTIVEADETLTATLGSSFGSLGTGINPADLSVSGSPRSASIINDDTAQLSVADVTVGEGDGVAVLTVTSSLISDGPITVDVATSPDSAQADSDFTSTSTTLTVTAGLTQTTVAIPILEDAAVEPTESFTVTLSNPGGTNADSTLIEQASATVTILDNDDGLVSVADGSVTEGDSGQRSMIFTVTLDVAVQNGLTVDYATADGTATTVDGDYVATSGTLTFSGTAEETQTVSVPVNGDRTVEADETFTLTLSGLVPHTNQSRIVTIGRAAAIGTIVNDDTAQLSVADVTVGEGDGVAVLTVTSSLISDGPITVDVATSPDSAQAGSDFTSTSTTLTITAGLTQTTVAIPILEDAAVEPTESFTVTLSNPTAVVSGGVEIAQASATVTILDNDDGLVSVADGSVTEGDSGQRSMIFTVTLDVAVQNGLTVDYATADGTATTSDGDYVATSGTLTFSGTAGETQTVSVPVNGDRKVEADETFTLTLSGLVPHTNQSRIVTIGRAAAIGTIRNDDATQLGVGNVSVAEDADGAVLVATLTYPSDFPVTARLSTAPGSATAGVDYVSTRVAITVSPGLTQTQAFVEILDDQLDENEETFVVNLDGVQGATPLASAMVTIRDNDPVPTAIFASANFTASEGSGSVGIGVRLTEPSGRTVRVSYATLSGGSGIPGQDYTPVSGTLTFSPGQQSQSFAIPVLGDDEDDGDKSVLLGLSSPTNAQIGTPGQALLTIRDEETTLYLPLIFGPVVAGPDLVVTGIGVNANDALTVVVQNQGNRPVENAFWVDLYIDPVPAPTSANQIWNDLGDNGAVWGVTQQTILPGESITLTVGGPFFASDFSLLPASLAPGTLLYAQVDSFNAERPFGGVLETHEISQDPYNNILGPVTYSGPARSWETETFAPFILEGDLSPRKK